MFEDFSGYSSNDQDETISKLVCAETKQRSHVGVQRRTISSYSFDSSNFIVDGIVKIHYSLRDTAGRPNVPPTELDAFSVVYD